jgi:hypothetical protein
MKIPDESLFREFKLVPLSTAQLVINIEIKKPSQKKALKKLPKTKRSVIQLPQPLEPHKPY